MSSRIFVNGLEFNGSCVSVTISGRPEPIMSISYEDRIDERGEYSARGKVRLRRSVASRLLRRRWDSDSVIVVNFSHPDIGSDSDLLVGANLVSLGQGSALLGDYQRQPLVSETDQSREPIAEEPDPPSDKVGRDILFVDLEIALKEILWTDKRVRLRAPREKKDFKSTTVEVVL